jgi:hypothetical protein
MSDAPILTLHERAMEAIAWERSRGCRMYYWPTPDSYVWQWPDGSLHLMTIMATDLYPEIEAIRQILHDSGERPPEGWLPRRERPKPVN